MNRKLDFLCIGARKAGTTSLFHYLKNHPQLRMPATKEAPFFNDEARWQAGWATFVAEEFGEPDEGVLLGKITPQYWLCHDETTPARIAELVPEVRLIAVLRNPIDRALSDYRFSLKKGIRLGSFADEVRKRDQVFFRDSRYGTLLKRYLAHFPREQLLVVFQETLDAQPGTVIDQVLVHVGLEPGYRPDNLDKRYNLGGTQKRFPRLIPTVRRIAPIRWLWRRLPKRARERFGFWYFDRVDFIPQQAEPMAAELRAELCEAFMDEMRMLVAATGIQLPWPEFAAANRPE